MRSYSSAFLALLWSILAAYVLRGVKIVVPERRWDIRRRNVVRTRGLTLAVATVVLAAVLLPADAVHGRTRTIQGYAHVTESFSPPYSDDASRGQQLSATGGPIFGTASLSGGSTASFNIIPAAGGGTASGQSAAVKFADWPRRNTFAEGYLRIADHFTINGVVTEESACRLTVIWSGALRPNADFEAEYAAAYGTKRNTASLSFDMTFGWLNSQGNYLLAISNRKDYGSSEDVDAVEDKRTFPIPFTEGVRTIGIDLTIGGAGNNGGGYSLLGIGGLDDQPSFAALSVGAEVVSAEDRSFEIIVELSPGLSISGQSAFVRQVTIPEPTAGALAPIGVLGLAVRRRRMPC